MRHGLFALGVAVLLVGGCDCGSSLETGGPAPKPVADTGKSAPVEVSRKPPFKVGTVDITWFELPPVEAPKREALAQWAKTALLAHPEFVGTDAAGATLAGKARVAGGEAKDGSGQILGAVTLDLRLETPAGVYETQAFIGEALPGKEPLEKELATFSEEIVNEVVHALVMGLRAEVASDEGLLKMLSGEDQAGIEPAILEARKRKLKAAAPALVKLLTHEEREIVNLAAGALGDVGDESAVPDLIDAGSRVQPVDRLPVLYAVGELGGPAAIIYLETVQKNAAHPAVRAAADSALQRARDER